MYTYYVYIYIYIYICICVYIYIYIYIYKGLELALASRCADCLSALPDADGHRSMASEFRDVVFDNNIYSLTLHLYFT